MNKIILSITLSIILMACDQYEPSIIPRSSFEPEYKRVARNESVKFINLSKNGSKYIWDFGDGGTSDLFEPTHTYINYGEYKVTLTTISSDGNEDEYSYNISVRQKNLEQIWITSNNVSSITPNLVIHIGEIDNSQNEWYLYLQSQSSSKIPLPVGGSLSLPEKNIVFNQEDWEIELIENISPLDEINEDDVIIGKSIFRPETNSVTRDNYGYGLIKVYATPFIIEFIYSI